MGVDSATAQDYIAGWAVTCSQISRGVELLTLTASHSLRQRSQLKSKKFVKQKSNQSPKMSCLKYRELTW